ncbi:MAG: carbohydrate ABC transporter permease [Rhodobacteraceae bacterium]|nr:carbohydrate ABC transporter permease [Paracoccaceae bacterium]
MAAPKALELPFILKVGVISFITCWCVIAAFPIFWIAVMSFKEPIDSFSSNPFSVIFGPETRASGKGLSIIDLVCGGVFIYAIARFSFKKIRHIAKVNSPFSGENLFYAIGNFIVVLTCIVILGIVLINVLQFVNQKAGVFGKPLIGFTMEHYYSVWIENAFYRNFNNSLIVTSGVVVISLTVGTLAGYALARSGSNLAFWILIAALIFRALPHSVLVSGYMPVFINSAEILEPLLGQSAPTLYGQPLAVIAVLVSINQPFTIWMLRAFFQNIPSELDEAARVDGCTHLKAFWWVIMPVMWPGVITTGLFSFLLAYNDYLVTSLLLDSQNQTMVPAITSYFNRETTTTDQVEAVAAAVSITAPLFMLVMIFQRHLISGLTTGAVKG